jgi:hypothetical protein
MKTLATVAETERNKSDADYVSRGLAKAVNPSEAASETGSGKPRRMPVGSVDADGERYEIGSKLFQPFSHMLGDWIMLQNPNDPEKPIIAQIFKTWETPRYIIF